MNEDIRILVLQRGRVVVGRYTIEGSWITLTDSRTVRRWGTTRGLEQLANHGPLDQDAQKTVLEERLAEPRHIHVLTTIEVIGCNAKAWADAL